MLFINIPIIKRLLGKLYDDDDSSTKTVCNYERVLGASMNSLTSINGCRQYYREQSLQSLARWQVLHAPSHGRAISARAPLRLSTYLGAANGTGLPHPTRRLPRRLSPRPPQTSLLVKKIPEQPKIISAGLPVRRTAGRRVCRHFRSPERKAASWRSLLANPLYLDDWYFWPPAG